MHSYFIFLTISSFVFFTCKAEDEYEYEDTEEIIATPPPTNEGGDGSRLVGARSAKRSSEAPFLVALNTDGWGIASTCTGSLITPSYVITASHCTRWLGKGDHESEEEECVRRTRAGKTYEINGNKLKCRIIETKDLKTKKIMRDLEMIKLDPVGKAWAAVKDMNDINAVMTKGKTSNIKRAIMPDYAYRGGSGYGSYGGYDIALLELETPFYGSNIQPACLPGIRFNDYADSKLAGYGRYFRQRSGEDICQTNRYGQMKYHYCETECFTDKKHPSSSETCKAFFRHHDVPDDKEEVMILRGQKADFCFREENKENKGYGWCYVDGNYYDPKRTKDAHGWGFCSHDCYLDKTDHASGVLRIVDNVKVVPEKLCSKFLKRSLSYSVDHTPKILCIGNVNKWKTDVWTMRGRSFKKYSGNREKAVRRHHYGEYLGFGGYVSSAGTCNGDSGGPVYQEETDDTGNKKYIVTGAVSGGRGKLGACGGINNPVHYSRVSQFTGWITQVLKEKKEQRNLCWDNDMERAMKRRGIKG